MVVLLVLLTVIAVLSIDWLISRRHAPQVALAPAAVESPPVFEPVFVAGYQLPEDRAYHRGHTWARIVGPDTVVVGMDDFARKLTGRADSVEMPANGAWLEQGAEGFRVQHGNRIAKFLSPVAGEVVDVNPAVAANPALATDDPYGRGWVLKIRSSGLVSNLKNLLSGSLARRWTEDAREQLELRLMAISGTVMQDGGTPAPDFADHLDAEEWKRLTGVFLLA